MAMTRYETIQGLGDDFMKLMARNIIPVHILDWKVYYEAYLKEAEALNTRYTKRQKTIAARIVADEYKISPRTMFNVIAFMEGK
jgi:hypothetical protein